MLSSHKFISMAALCCGIFALNGCSHQATVSNGVPIPPPQAAPSAQVQIQQVENDPHIPAAQKPGIEASIAHNNGIPVNQTPPNGQ